MRTFAVAVIFLAVLVLEANRSSSGRKFLGYDKMVKMIKNLMGNSSFIEDVKDISRKREKTLKNIAPTNQHVETRELPNLHISHKLLLKKFCSIPKYKELCIAGDELDYVARVVDAEYGQAPRYKPEFAGEPSFPWENEDLTSYDDDDVDRLEKKYREVLHNLYDFPAVYEESDFVYGYRFAMCTWDPK